jgi:hypothetical protein
MTSGFDDHSTVVVLEFVVRQLLSRDCRNSTDPRHQLEY